MSPSPNSEKALVEQSAEEILSVLGWRTLAADKESFGAGTLLGRSNAREVALAPRVRAALAKLNPKATTTAIQLALDELLRDRGAMGLVYANRELHKLMLEGVKVTVKDLKSGKDEPVTLRVVNWDDAEENEFLAVRQFSLLGPLYRCVPDLVLFVNGLPWVVIELKRPGVPARQGFDDNLTSYKHRRTAPPALQLQRAPDRLERHR